MIPTTLGIWIDGWNVKVQGMTEKNARERDGIFLLQWYYGICMLIIVMIYMIHVIAEIDFDIVLAIYLYYYDTSFLFQIGFGYDGS